MDTIPTQEQTAPLVGIIIQDWTERADQAIRELQSWKFFLTTWRTQLQTNPGQRIPDSEFMAAVDKMAQAGLLEFIDSHELDELREMLTGVEA